MEVKQPEGTSADAGKSEKRTPRSIRFHDPEWERIETFAEERGLAAAEFVRFAACQRRREYVPARRRKNVPRARW